RRALCHPRRRPRQLALPDLSLQRVQPLAVRLDPRLHPHRPALVLRPQPGADGGGGDQLAAVRVPRHRHVALRIGTAPAVRGLRWSGPRGSSGILDYLKKLSYPRRSSLTSHWTWSPDGELGWNNPH